MYAIVNKSNRIGDIYQTQDEANEYLKYNWMNTPQSISKVHYDESYNSLIDEYVQYQLSRYIIPWDHNAFWVYDHRSQIVYEHLSTLLLYCHKIYPSRFDPLYDENTGQEIITNEVPKISTTSLNKLEKVYLDIVCKLLLQSIQRDESSFIVRSKKLPESLTKSARKC